MAENRIQLEQFKDRIIFMSVDNDIDWTKDGNEQMCILNSSEVKAYAKRFPEGHGPFLGPGTEEKWCGTDTCEPEGLWNRSAEMILLHFRESGHPLFRATGALDRGSLEGKGGKNIIDSLQK